MKKSEYNILKSETNNLVSRNILRQMPTNSNLSESNTTKNSEVAERGRATMKMSKEKIDISMFAPCGMNCKVCYKHCYHKKPCAGCLNSDKGKPEHCRKCKIKDCIKEKSLSYCFECAKYPCSLIKNLEKSYNKRYQVNILTLRSHRFIA